MIRKGSVVSDEDGELFVVAEITTKIVLCYRYSHQPSHAAFVFNPYQLQEVQEKGIKVDNRI